MIKLGFCTDYSKERITFAQNAGFDCLEIGVGPGGKIDVEKIDEKKIEEIKGVFNRAGIRIATMMCAFGSFGAVNHLDPDPVRRKESNDYFIKVLKSAKKFGVNVVCTNTFGDKNIKPEDNLSMYKKVFSEYAKVAEDNGVKIAMENCPHRGGYPLTIGNIGYSPSLWEKLFSEVSSPAIGLEYDPSHLYWLGVDYIKNIYTFSSRIYAFHAKDIEILRENLAKEGIYGNNWWRFRLPGLGEIDWKGIFRTLYDIGYNGDILIEHEDSIMCGARMDEGLKLGLKYLKTFIV
jgi:sugar phosphate isomerase/epimerase